MTDTTQTARPVPPADLPVGAACALTADGHLSHEDRWQIDRFTRLLADKATVMREYAATLDQVTPAHAYAALRPIPAQHAHDAELVRLWSERAGRLRDLYREYDVDTNPTATTGEG